MKAITCVILMLVIFLSADAQQNPVKDEGKKNTGVGKPTVNPGDPTNAITDKQQKAGGDKTATPNQNKSKEEKSLLGDDNDKADIKTGNSRDDYRNNRVSGNPNNRSSAEGSNRRSVSGETDESSTATPRTMKSDTASAEAGFGEVENAGPTSAFPASNSDQSANVPPIDQESTSGSGSPAILSDNDGTNRDGTNNVQRATPNMAGSPVGDLSTKKKNVDADKEIREGTSRQQRNPSGNDIRDSQSQKKSSANGDAKDQVKPENKNRETSASGDNQDVSVKNSSNAAVSDAGNSSSSDKKNQRKEKRKKRKDRN